MPRDRIGDAALVPAGVAPSVADFRFCRLGRLLGALAFNGSRSLETRTLSEPRRPVSGARFSRMAIVRAAERDECAGGKAQARISPSPADPRPLDPRGSGSDRRRPRREKAAATEH
jgi:hypothetical protein